VGRQPNLLDPVKKFGSSIADVGLPSIARLPNGMAGIENARMIEFFAQGRNNQDGRVQRTVFHDSSA
jgi:hypothetical protein